MRSLRGRESCFHLGGRCSHQWIDVTAGMERDSRPLRIPSQLPRLADVLSLPLGPRVAEVVAGALGELL